VSPDCRVHRIREQMWDECGGDLDRLIELLRAGEAEHRERIISKEELNELRSRDRPPPAPTAQ
jgi:hypothetical protein